MLKQISGHIRRKYVLPGLVMSVLLSVCLAASGANESGQPVAESALSKPQTQAVEPYTPPKASAELTSANTKTLRNDRPSPASTLTLEAMDSQTLTLRKNATDAVGTPHQIGAGRSISALSSSDDLAKRLQWTPTSSGGLTASIRFVATGAVGTRLMLAIERLDPRTVLRFYGQAGTEATEVTGTEVLDTLSHNRVATPATATSQNYVGPYVEGEEVTLELELPAGVLASSLRLNVPTLSQVYQSPTAASFQLKIGNSSSCEVDVACRSDWQSTANSVARMVFSDASTGNSYTCTGTLVNDRASSGTAYFLTARHCISTQAMASTLQTFWFYRAPSCGSGTLYSGTQSRSGGATLLYTNSTTDTAFLKLNSAVPSGVTYSGWMTSTVSVGTSIGGVHHPKGDVQKVSLGAVSKYVACSGLDNADGFSCTSNLGSGGASHIDVSWSSGMTESGSSGSALFVTNAGQHYLVGQLTGGSSACNDPSSFDVYGRFDIPYQAALYNWLDNTSATRSAIYRFFNTATGAHFFTADSAERDYVIANYKSYNYEGTAFYAYKQAATGLTAVYRFYNSATKSHFFTANSFERDYVIANYKTFNDEGIAWYAKADSDGTNSPLFRFYNRTSGTHFYTISALERDYVRQSLPTYNDEGTAYYAWTTP